MPQSAEPFAWSTLSWLLNPRSKQAAIGSSEVELQLQPCEERSGLLAALTHWDCSSSPDRLLLAPRSQVMHKYVKGSSEIAKTKSRCPSDQGVQVAVLSPTV